MAGDRTPLPPLLLLNMEVLYLLLVSLELLPVLSRFLFSESEYECTRCPSDEMLLVLFEFYLKVYGRLRLRIQGRVELSEKLPFLNCRNERFPAPLCSYPFWFSFSMASIPRLYVGSTFVPRGLLSLICKHFIFFLDSVFLFLTNGQLNS